MPRMPIATTSHVRALLYSSGSNYSSTNKQLESQPLFIRHRSLRCNLRPLLSQTPSSDPLRLYDSRTRPCVT